jgi:uncharacterized membrane protein (UPF0127 family)
MFFLDTIVAAALPRARAALAAIAFALSTPAFAQGAAPAKPLPVVTLKVAGHALKAEVVATPELRARGLMFREKLGRNDGMLFIFDEPGYHSMWMMNTFIPLSVAFVDGEGRILNIEDMQPRTLDSHVAQGPARYAVETNIGWFAERRIKAGDKITGLPKP